MGEYQILLLFQVGLNNYPTEHRHCECMGVLHPDVISPRYPPVIHVEHQVLLYRCPYQPLPRLLWSTNYLQHHYHHHIHHNIKYHGGCRIALRNYYPCDESHP